MTTDPRKTLIYNVPLGGGFIAQLLLPHDLKPEECVRLCELLKTLQIKETKQ